jgi:hypothetical protein
VQVTFQLTAEDYRQGFLAWRDLRPWRRWSIRIFVVFLGLIFLISIVQLLVASGNFVNALPGFVVSVGALVVIFAGPSLTARRQFRTTPSAHDPMTIEASDAGLRIHSVHAESQVAWSAYMAWGEYKSVFVILPQPRIYVPIPKRAFTAEQLVEFRELLDRNIKPRSK